MFLTTVFQQIQKSTLNDSDITPIFQRAHPGDKNRVNIAVVSDSIPVKKHNPFQIPQQKKNSQQEPSWPLFGIHHFLSFCFSNDSSYHCWGPKWQLYHCNSQTGHQQWLRVTLILLLRSINLQIEITSYPQFWRLLWNCQLPFLQSCWH